MNEVSEVPASRTGTKKTGNIMNYRNLSDFLLDHEELNGASTREGKGVIGSLTQKKLEKQLNLEGQELEYFKVLCMLARADIPHELAEKVRNAFLDSLEQALT